MDLEIPNDQVAESLIQVDFAPKNINDLLNRDKNHSTQIIKITFRDHQNSNTFFQNWLQIDSMHFSTESAKQNTAPTQCLTCLKYNYTTEYCKGKTQVYARYGANHRIDSYNGYTCRGVSQHISR